LTDAVDCLDAELVAVDRLRMGLVTLNVVEGCRRHREKHCWRLGHDLLVGLLETTGEEPGQKVLETDVLQELGTHVRLDMVLGSCGRSVLRGVGPERKEQASCGHYQDPLGQAHGFEDCLDREDLVDLNALGG
jgi:hypothetical protein